MQESKFAPSIPGYSAVTALRTSPEIWRAQKESDESPVAIWLLDPKRNPVLPSKLRLARRRLLAATRSSIGFVNLLDSGLASDGRPFVAVPDQTTSVLTDRLDAGPLRWRDAVALVKQLATTANVVHERGLVLGDLRPDAVWFDDADQPLILAWGMSTRYFDDGAPTFLAPEAQNGGPTSPATDVYSLLLLMAALILGRTPEHGEPVSRYLNQAKELVPDRIGAVLEHGLATAPGNRFGNGRALATALEVAQESIDKPHTNAGPAANLGPVASPSEVDSDHTIDIDTGNAQHNGDAAPSERTGQIEIVDIDNFDAVSFDPVDIDSFDPVDIDSFDPVDIDSFDPVDIDSFDPVDIDAADTESASVQDHVLDFDSLETLRDNGVGQATIEFDSSLAEVALDQLAAQSERDDPTTIWDDAAPLSAAVPNADSDMAVLDLNALEKPHSGGGDDSPPSAATTAAATGTGLLLSDGSLPTTDLSREQLQQWTRELQTESAASRLRTRLELFWFRSRRAITTAVALICLAAIAAVIVFLTARELQAGTEIVSSGNAPDITTTVVQRSLVIAEGVPYLTEAPPTYVTVTAPPRTTASTSTTVAPAAPTTAPPTTAAPTTAPPTTAAPTTRPRPTTAPPTTAAPTTRPRPTTAPPTTAAPTTRRRPTTAPPTTAAPTTRRRPTTTAPEVLPPPAPDADNSDDSD